MLSACCGAEILTVDDDGPADHPTIQSAVEAASDGDEILVQPGTYRGSGEAVVRLEGRALLIRSAAGPADTVIDGEGLRRCLTITGGGTAPPTIEGFTLTGGRSGWVDLDGDGIEDPLESIGGGVLLVGGRPRFRNCVFTRNEAEVGGAVHARDARVSFIDCDFTENVAIAGGAVSNNDASSGLLRRCDFVRNVAPKGGAVENRGSSDPRIDGCRFEGHFSISGSCILNVDSGPTISACTFQGNSSNRGGAVYDTGGSRSTIVGSVFTMNTATEDGGAVGVFASTTTIVDCIFRENSAASRGGAIHAVTGSRPEVSGSTFEGNRAVFGGGIANEAETEGVIRDCRFEWNRAEFTGGSIDGDVSSLAILSDSRLCGSVPNPIGGTWRDEGGNAFAGNCASDADLDDDGMVDGADLLVLLSNWGPCPDGMSCAGDLDRSADVDGADLLLLLADWSG